MRGERHALRAGEYLVSRACRRLPARIREERYLEWLAELPVILHDREAGPAPLRVVRMLAFAADTLRGTTLAPDAYRGAHRGGAVKTIRWLAVGLLLLSAPLGALLALLAYEGYIVYQLIAGASLISARRSCWSTWPASPPAASGGGTPPLSAGTAWAKWRREPACSSGRSPPSPAGVAHCCSRSSATAATRFRPPALA